MTKELETAKRTNLAIVDQAMLVETEVSAAKDEVRSLAPRFAAGAWGCGCARARAAPRTRLIAPASAWISTSLCCSAAGEEEAEGAARADQGVGGGAVPGKLSRVRVGGRSRAGKPLALAPR